jgi:hypothetical protein
LESLAPSRVDIPKLAKLGLAKFDSVDGIIFGKTWDYSRVVEALHEYLPDLFRYLEELPDCDNPHWVLCFRKKKLLHIAADAACPTGQDLDLYKGTSRASWSDCFIWIGKFQLKQNSNTYGLPEIFDSN